MLSTNIRTGRLTGQPPREATIYRGRVKVTVPPTEQPITLDQLKAHLRITSVVWDDYLTSLLPVATDIVQQYLGRKLITQTLQMSLDESANSNAWWDGTLQASAYSVFGGASPVIELAWLPCASVAEIKIFDEDDNETIVPSSVYQVDTIDPDKWARIALRRSQVWPTTNGRALVSFQVTYVVGYGLADDVPPAITHGTLMVAAYLYANRGDCTDGCVCDKSGVSGLLAQYRVRKL